MSDARTLSAAAAVGVALASVSSVAAFAADAYAPPEPGFYNATVIIGIDPVTNKPPSRSCRYKVGDPVPQHIYFFPGLNRAGGTWWAARGPEHVYIANETTSPVSPDPGGVATGSFNEVIVNNLWPNGSVQLLSTGSFSNVRTTFIDGNAFLLEGSWSSSGDNCTEFERIILVRIGQGALLVSP